MKILHSLFIFILTTTIVCSSHAAGDHQHKKGNSGSETDSLLTTLVPLMEQCWETTKKILNGEHVEPEFREFFFLSKAAVVAGTAIAVAPKKCVYMVAGGLIVGGGIGGWYCITQSENASKE